MALTITINVHVYKLLALSIIAWKKMKDNPSRIGTTVDQMYDWLVDPIVEQLKI